MNESLAQLLFLLSLASSLIYIFYLLVTFYHNTFRSPLSSIPNASVFAPFSRLLWALPLEYRGRLTMDLPLLHEKKGPLLRIGPNELSFYSLEIYNTIYSIRSPFVKDPRVYGQFVQDAHPALFSITDEYEHSQRRRLMGQLFNLSKMNLLEPMMTERISHFIHLLYQNQNRPIEVIQACRALEADIVSAFGFGQEIGALTSWGKSEPLNMIKANDDKSKVIALFSSFPALTAAWYNVESILYRTLGYQSDSTAAIKEFDNWSSSQLNRLTSLPKHDSRTQPNFIDTMIRSRLPADSALSEAKEMLGPGTDTTSATLAHILFGLAHDLKFQEDLAQDLEDAGWPTDIAVLEKLTKLRAAVKEGIRWTGAAAAMLPRIVPEEGAILAGKFIPGGTIVSSSPIWYLRDKSAFPSPEIYRPARWLEDSSRSPNADTLRDDYYIPFSKGSAACIGAHFAYYELYLSVSEILKYFRVVLPSAGAFMPSKEAKLPDRLEWVAAVPVSEMLLQFQVRKGIEKIAAF